jgi:hypothetical protein
MINGYNQVSVSSIENFNIMVRLMMIEIFIYSTYLFGLVTVFFFFFFEY